VTEEAYGFYPEATSASTGDLKDPGRGTGRDIPVPPGYWVLTAPVD
jgi:hypothetical protein